MRVASLLVMLVLLASCGARKGEINVKEKLEFKHTTIFGNVKKKTLKPGEYKAKFSTTIGKKLKIVFKNKAGDKTKVKLKLKDDFNLPDRNGDFYYSDTQLDQNFSFKGVVDTEYNRSDTYSGSESCTYTTSVTKCGTRCHDEDNFNGTGRTVRVCTRECWDETVTHYGSQEVEYYYTYRTTRYDYHFLKGGSQDLKDSLASFSGVEKNSSKNYTYTGACY